MTDDFDMAFYIEGVTLTLVSIFGLLGNTLCIIVLFRGAFRNAFSSLLRGLAFCDALFLVCAILSFGLPQLTAYYKDNVFPLAAPILFGFIHTFRVGSVYVTMAVTLERFLVICFPLRGVTRSRQCRRTLLPASLLSAVIFNIPKYFEHKCEWNEKSSVYSIIPTDLRMNGYYVSFYVVWSKLIFTEIIPYVTIIILNVLIVVKAARSTKFRSQFTTNAVKSCNDVRKDIIDNKDNAEENSSCGKNLLSVPNANRGRSRSLDTTAAKNDGSTENIEMQLLLNSGPKSKLRRASTMQGLLSGSAGALILSRFSCQQQQGQDLVRVLIGISILFICCQSLKIVPDLYELFACPSQSEGGCTDVPWTVTFIMNISHLLVCVNSAANFLFYFLHGAKFRAAFKETFLSL